MNLGEVFTNAWQGMETQLFILLALTVVDVVFGITLAVIGRNFKWDYLTNYLQSDFLPIIAWMAVAVLGAFPLPKVADVVLPWGSEAVYATVFLKLAASVLGHFQKIGVIKQNSPQG